MGNAPFVCDHKAADAMQDVCNTARVLVVYESTQCCHLWHPNTPAKACVLNCITTHSNILCCSVIYFKQNKKKKGLHEGPPIEMYGLP